MTRNLVRAADTAAGLVSLLRQTTALYRRGASQPDAAIQRIAAKPLLASRDACLPDQVETLRGDRPQDPAGLRGSHGKSASLPPRPLDPLPLHRVHKRSRPQDSDPSTGPSTRSTVADCESSGPGVLSLQAAGGDDLSPRASQQPFHDGSSYHDSQRGTNSSQEEQQQRESPVESAAIDLEPLLQAEVEPQPGPRKLLSASRVPTSRFARLLQYGNLAAGLGAGAAGAAIRNLALGRKDGRVVFNQANINRMVKTLSKMRGAALKLGQFLSIQESKLLPPELEVVLSRMQNAADYMPEWQTRQVLAREMGPDWESHFSHFDIVPIAAASIGQVHSATTVNGDKVAVKIQFPGVAESIESDIANLASILTFSAVLPKGLFLDNTLRVMKQELADECDYLREAHYGRMFQHFLKDDPVFVAPKVHDHLSTARILTTDFMPGVPLKETMGLSQDLRNHIGSSLIRLCLQELFHYKTMQTDPNWSNFLWDPQTRTIALIDFGATRAYDPEFIQCYKTLLLSAVRKDRHACEKLSREIGYLTTADSQDMIDAHLESMLALAEPFQHEGAYPFAEETVTRRVREHIPTMLRHRQRPPPTPTYSLNRKLSGSFLLCARLKSLVDCNGLLQLAIQGERTVPQ